VTVVIFVVEPDTPPTLTVNVPVAVPAVVLMVMVLVPEPATVAGLKVAVAPEGTFMVRKLTVPVKPPDGVMVTV